MKRLHRELVKAGMERARQHGKRIGRPKVTERPGFSQRFAEAMERVGPGRLSRRRAAKELGIGYATLKRLLDAHPQSRDYTLAGPAAPAVPSVSGNGHSHEEGPRALLTESLNT